MVPARIDIWRSGRLAPRLVTPPPKVWRFARSTGIFYPWFSYSTCSASLTGMQCPSADTDRIFANLPRWRSNIGSGRLYGLEEDLVLKRNQFQTATSVFFATYVVSNFQVVGSWTFPDSWLSGIGLRSPFYDFPQKTSSCKIHQWHSSPLGDYRDSDRLDQQLWKFDCVSPIAWTGRRSFVSLSDYLLDLVLYMEGIGRAFWLPD